MNTLHKVPVSILTGFLGSGKTTLLNRILSEEHGKRIAVIENEFGEVGIDQALVIDADEEIFEMSNGCICCTVRGDLIRVLGNLMKRRDKFDYVLVETTGLADPGPVAQTFFMDDEIRAEFSLDGIVTLVDAAHIEQQLGRSDESTEQIAFADVLVLNKTDLVDGEALDRLEARLREMNRMAQVVRSERADVPVDTVLNLGAFDLEQVVERRPTFLEPEYPFEWTGVYSLDSGRYELSLADGPDPAMSLVVVSDQGTDDAALRDGAEWCVRRYAEPAAPIRPGDRDSCRRAREPAARFPGAQVVRPGGRHAGAPWPLRPAHRGRVRSPTDERTRRSHQAGGGAHLGRTARARRRGGLDRDRDRWRRRFRKAQCLAWRTAS